MLSDLSFIAYISFFEEESKELDKVIDEVAESARSLGRRSLGTLIEFLKNTNLKENPGKHPDAREMISNLLADQEAVIGRLRVDLGVCADKYQDMGTNNFLSDLMESHENMAWMLRAFLEGNQFDYIGGNSD